MIARSRGSGRSSTGRQSRNALARATARFNGIIASAMDAIISVNVEQRIMLFNPAAEKMFGVTAEDALGQHLNRFLPERFRAAHTRHVEHFGQTGTSARHMGALGKIYGLRAGGQEFPIEASISQVNVSGERIFTVILRDITLREQAQTAQARLAAIVQSSEDPILSTNLEGIITSWNPAAERLFGYCAGEIVGQPITRLIPPELQSEEPLILERLRQGQRIDHYETVRIARDGHRIEVALTISPIREPDGSIVGASKIVRDITERKRVERALQKAREELARANEDLERRVQQRTATLRETVAELETFSYSLSHDMRAPLRAIQSYIQIALEQCADKIGAPSAQLLQNSIAAAERMDRLIQDMLALTSLSSQQIELTPVNPEEALRRITSDHSDLQPPQAELRIQSPLLPMFAHETLLAQCLANLLANAVKFVPRGVKPQIRIWTEPVGNPKSEVQGPKATQEPASGMSADPACSAHPGSQHSTLNPPPSTRFVRLWVEDNGIGIKPEAQRKIFGVFQRLHSSGEYTGTGIGLAIVRRAVEKMGGQAGVESEPGKGSRFWIELPAAST